MKYLWLISLTVILLTTGTAFPGGDTLYLWPDGAPGATGDTEDDKPKLTYFPSTAQQQLDMAFIICPGGGYQKKYFGYDLEGVPTAEWFAAHGIPCFILTYRCSPGYYHPHPLMDGKRAIRYVRAHASNFNINTQKIGMLGFSAGAHLATTVGTKWDNGDPQNSDPVEQVSCRPDFMILNSAVISLREEVTHPWTRAKLLGESQSEDSTLILSLSNEMQVTPETPPTFIVHSEADTLVKAMNSIFFEFALEDMGVAVKRYELPGKRHSLPVTDGAWGDSCLVWLEAQGILPIHSHEYSGPSVLSSMQCKQPRLVNVHGFPDRHTGPAGILLQRTSEGSTMSGSAIEHLRFNLLGKTVRAPQFESLF